MDKLDKEYFFIRNDTDLHIDKIKSETDIHKNPVDVKIENVFKHQKAAFWRENEYPKPNSDIYLPYYFYNECYIETEVTIGFTGRKISIDEFLLNNLNRNSLVS